MAATLPAGLLFTLCPLGVSTVSQTEVRIGSIQSAQSGGVFYLAIYNILSSGEAQPADEGAERFTRA